MAKLNVSSRKNLHLNLRNFKKHPVFNSRNYNQSFRCLYVLYSDFNRVIQLYRHYIVFLSVFFVDRDHKSKRSTRF